MDQKRGCFVLNRWAWLAYAGVALAAFGILFLYAGEKSFFSDEMYQLGVCSFDTRLADVLRDNLTMRDPLPPLFNLLAWLWYRIVPYGQRWLQLLPILLTCGGVYVTGLAGKAYRGPLTGVFAALFGMGSGALLITCGLQFRQYGLLFFVSALTAYGYFRRNRHAGRERWGDLAFYGVAMALMPYTHYLSVLVPVTLFAVDAVEYLRGKISLRCLSSYLLGGGLFLPWGLSLLRHAGGRSSFWIDAPRLSDIPAAFRYLSDENGLLFLLLVGGACIALATLAFSPKGTKQDDPRELPLLIAAVPLVTVLGVYGYSAYVNPSFSLFLPRYFLGCLPFVLLTEAYAAERTLTFLSRGGEKRVAAAALCGTLAVLLCLRSFDLVHRDVKTVFEPYREAADFLSEQPDISEPGTAVLTSNLGAYVTRGWVEYYVTRQGRREAFPVYDYDTPFTEDMAEEYGVVYTFTEHAAQPGEAARILAERYRPDPDFTEGAAWGVVRYVRAEG